MRRYHISACPDLDDACLDDAIEEAMNDRFEETHTRCECCGALTPCDQTGQNSWFNTLCTRCLPLRPCDGCGEPLHPHQLTPLDDEYYCTSCLTAIRNQSGTPTPKNDTL
ncbi:MAG: hypothetical protein J1E02_07930 [Coprobacter sp.]|nr:hypothetical protein [Coprobacter sp.]